MTENAKATSSTPAADDLQTELEQLKAENERLKATEAVTEQERHARTVRIWRWVAAALLIVIGASLAFWGIGAYWVNRFVMDTDTFVSTLSPLAEDPAVQTAVADAVDNAVFNSIDIEKQLTNLLVGLQDVIAPALEKRGIPAGQLPASALAAPLASSIQNTQRCAKDTQRSWPHSTAPSRRPKTG